MLFTQTGVDPKVFRHFSSFRAQIIGHDAEILTPFGHRPLVYADWTASGRLYAPIEHRISHELGVLVGNTHSESTATGMAMTHAYHLSHHIIKKHVNAGPDDALLPCGSGMTGAVNKLQRILGLKVHEKYSRAIHIPEAQRPVVFVTHMEHHSNQTSWIETIADVEVVAPNAEGLVCTENLRELLHKYRHRRMKIGAFTSCSNVTGISTPYHEMARIMHEYDGFCFVDFAASAPYIDIDMHPADDPLGYLDAIYFSPHKFLGGPGSSGAMVLNSKLYQNYVPDNVGGGVVAWTNPWGEHRFVDDIEAREDAGTPAFLQTIKAALCIGLKDKLGVAMMHRAEKVITHQAMNALQDVSGLHILAGNNQERLSIISFYVEGIHYNLLVKILNDKYGIQARGGCSCAGTYGHYLLHVQPDFSRSITDKIDAGDNSGKPGWVRISFHPTTTPEEVTYITDAIAEAVNDIEFWRTQYKYSSQSNEFSHLKQVAGADIEAAKKWFVL